MASRQASGSLDATRPIPRFTRKRALFFSCSRKGSQARMGSSEKILSNMVMPPGLVSTRSEAAIYSYTRSVKPSTSMLGYLPARRSYSFWLLPVMMVVRTLGRALRAS